MKKILLLIFALLISGLSTPIDGACKKYYLYTISYYDYSPGTPNLGCQVERPSTSELWKILYNYTDVKSGASIHRYKMYWKIYSNCGTTSSGWWFWNDPPILPIYLN